MCGLRRRNGSISAALFTKTIRETWFPLAKSAKFNVKISAVALCIVTGLMLAGCNSGSPSVSIIQSNDNATIAALNSALATAQATLTTVDTLTTQLAAAQIELGTDRAQLISQLNAVTPTPPAQVAPP